MAHECEVQYYKESSQKKLSIHDFIKLDNSLLKPLLNNNNSLGFSQNSVWVKVNCINLQIAKKYYLEIGYPLLDKVELFNYKGEKINEVGDTVQFDNRPVNHRNPVFSLDFLYPESIYLKISSTGSIQLPIKILPLEAFQSHWNMENIFFGIYYGIMLSMLIYNLLLAFFVKDRSYVYYSFYTLSYLLFQAGLNGFAYQWIWKDQFEWSNRSLPFFMWLSFSFMFLFARRFLNLKYSNSTLSKILFYNIIFSFLYSILSLDLDYKLAMIPGIFYSYIVVVLMIYSGISSYKSGYKPAIYFIIAWISFLVGIVLMGFKNFGLLPSNAFTTYSIQIGSALDVLLLSLGLGSKLDLSKDEKSKKEKELIRFSKLLDLSNKELQEKQKLADLARQVSHDIRSPLSTLNLLIPQNPDDKKNNLIRNSLNSIYEIADKLLIKYRFEEKSQFQICNITEVAKNICEEKKLQNFKNITILFGNEFNDEIFVSIPEIDLKCILSNLINNSIDSIHTNGIITLKLNRNKNNVKIKILDTGCGIPKEIINVIGKEKISYGKSDGNGLGLFHSIQMIESSGGTFNIKSKINYGTKIEIIFNVYESNSSRKNQIELSPSFV